MSFAVLKFRAEYKMLGFFLWDTDIKLVMCLYQKHFCYFLLYLLVSLKYIKISVDFGGSYYIFHKVWGIYWMTDLLAGIVNKLQRVKKTKQYIKYLVNLATWQNIMLTTYSFLSQPLKYQRWFSYQLSVQRKLRSAVFWSYTLDQEDLL